MATSTNSAPVISISSEGTVPASSTGGFNAVPNICEAHQCNYFIRRKGRKCSHRIAAGGDGMHCTEHTDQALEAARRVAESAQIDHACRKVLSEILDNVCGKSSDDKEDLTELTRKRKKQHLRVSAPKRMANPFSTDLTPSLDGLRYYDFFDNADRPLHIDVGCARGRCSELLAHSVERAEWNNLGLEIRPNIVHDALIRVFGEGYAENEAIRSENKSNLYYLTCNFAASANDIFNMVPAGRVRLVSIQFPDPWVRRRKHLRRMLVQPALVQVMSEHMIAGSCVYISSDSERGMNWMLQCFAGAETSYKPLPRDEVHARCNKNDNMFVMNPKPRIRSAVANLTSTSQVPAGAGECSDDANSEDGEVGQRGENATEPTEDNVDTISWVAKYSEYMLSFNPLGVPSEREMVCEIKWKKVWRIVFERQ